MMIEKTQYIDGQWVTGAGKTFHSINPANTTTVWEGYFATSDDINLAMRAAHYALPSWAGLDIDIRRQYVRAFAKKVAEEREVFARIIALESGKPYWEALTEVTAIINKIEISIQAQQERNPIKHTPSAEANTCLRFKPHGVVVVLGPFNFPAHLSNGHIVPALLAGNTIIYKPSELTPAVGAFMTMCWDAIGLPAGVLQCIQGDAEIAKSLLKQDIQAVYFTGSYHVGLQINRSFVDRPEVILALEMGGNNPLIIDNPKNEAAAIYHTLLSTLITAGQRCSCARRVMIPDTAQGDSFLHRLIKAYTTVRIGDAFAEPQPFMGPVIRYAHALKHIEAQDKLIALGGHSLLKMELRTGNTGFLSPGIIDMTNVGTASPDEEIFAPFTQIYRYKTFDDAIMLANQTRYGLVAGLFSDDAAHYEMFYAKVRAGLINWNRPTTGAASQLPFGGIGTSGNHRPSAYFAADYTAYPVASLETSELQLPATPLPGIEY